MDTKELFKLKICRLLKTRLGGIMTIEISLLIPFILFLIWNLLFLSFFLYNQSTAFQGCYATALRTERWLGTVSDKEAEASKKYEEAVASKLACGEDTVNLRVTDKDVVIGADLSMNAPGSPLYDSLWKGRVEGKADEWAPVRYIRNIRKGLALVNTVKEGP